MMICKNNDIGTEEEADYFAISLLVPEHRLIAILKETRREELSLIAEHFGVSQNVLINRIKQLRGDYL